MRIRWYERQQQAPPPVDRVEQDDALVVGPQQDAAGLSKVRKHPMHANTRAGHRAPSTPVIEGMDYTRAGNRVEHPEARADMLATCRNGRLPRAAPVGRARHAIFGRTRDYSAGVAKGHPCPGNKRQRGGGLKCGATIAGLQDGRAGSKPRRLGTGEEKAG